MSNLAKWPPRGANIAFSPAVKPRLAIVVHTEEEFDWDAPFDRAANAVSHVPELSQFQTLANERGYVPHYSCGYPITQDAQAAAFFKPLFESGAASLGAHLHPWVCPPFEEDVTNYNSFPGNLAEPLEHQKIATLTDALEAAFGIRPVAYLAGRYGYGPNTTAILEKLGYIVDFSIAPGWDYRRYDGPNWRDHSSHACFNADTPSLLHVPHSGGHIGFLCSGGLRKVQLGEDGAAALLRLPSIAARSGAIRQARITIEGMDLSAAKTLARDLYEDGVRLFTMSFHSPTAAVGHTPYSPTKAARDGVFQVMAQFLDFFTHDLGGQTATPEDMYALAQEALHSAHQNTLDQKPAA